MNAPAPRPGQVVHYNYLWRHEARAGLEQSPYSRACAIVIAVARGGGQTLVVLAPITHTAPREAGRTIELPPSIKAHLGLDEARSWVITDDLNVCEWPSPDLEPIPAGPKVGEWTYGALPPRLYDKIREGILADAVAPTKRTGVD